MIYFTINLHLWAYINPGNVIYLQASIKIAIPHNFVVVTPASLSDDEEKSCSVSTLPPIVLKVMYLIIKTLIMNITIILISYIKTA